ncbi:MAG TPA: chemotaxis protein CheA, partial [Tepidiformaceae bacterium]|nr:chemotaxis protein CheA [Tepidiformaceae bacterium]
MPQAEPPLQFDLDDEDLKLFIDEAEEQFELLDTAIVQLEDAPRPELLQAIFRAAHTLKGSSATIGHEKMTALTHAMETVLDALRQGDIAPTPAMVDALLGALDALRVLAVEVATRIDSGTDIQPLETALRTIVNRQPTPAAANAPEPASSRMEPSQAATRAMGAAIEHGQTAYAVGVTVAPDCQLPSIRCYQVLQELDAISTVHECWPGRAEIDAGAGEYAFTAFVTSGSMADDIRDLLLAISDIATAAIEPVSASTPGQANERGNAAGIAPILTLVDPNAVGASPPRAKASQSIRIDVERLDGLMNLVGELVIDRTRLQQIRTQLGEVLRDAKLTELSQNFEETTNHLAHITGELQEEIMRSRMLPIRTVLARLPRIVRDVATRCEKQVELITAGEDTELDRSVAEEIADPLVHVLRNAIDHGIETPAERLALAKPESGTISVTAWNQESSIFLSVTDDGRGIDTAALRRKAVERGLVTAESAAAASDDEVVQYIFIAGLSTARELSDVSGRGVGMDIVRTNIERLHGQVTVRSEPGRGCEFIIQLPLTLATTRALMVAVNGTVCALPLVSVTEALSERNADLYSVGGHTTLLLRGRLLPVIDLGRALGDARTQALDGSRFVIAAKHGDREVAFLVDRLLGEQDVVVKSLGPLLRDRKGLSGATIL